MTPKNKKTATFSSCRWEWFEAGRSEMIRGDHRSDEPVSALAVA